MRGRGICNLPKGPRRFRPNLRTEAFDGKIRFETKWMAALEDGRRIRGVRKVLEQSGKNGHIYPPAGMQSLIESLQEAHSPASSRYMRKWRKRITASLWQWVRYREHLTSTFTIISRNWEFAGGRLHEADPTKLLAGFRQTLNRAGAVGCEGWLFAAIHGEYEPNEDIFRLHIHGIAQGPIRNVIGKLRKLPQFRKGPGKLSKVKVKRVVLSRKPLHNLPEPITYVVQSFWPARSIYEDMDGKVSRQRSKRRIQEPRHTEVLLWQNRWRLTDTTFSMGIAPHHSGFYMT